MLRIAGLFWLSLFPVFAGSISYSVSVLPVVPYPDENAPVNGINDFGQAAGTISIFGPNQPRTQADIVSTSGVAILPVPPGWQASYGNSINDSGQVVGYVDNVPSPYTPLIVPSSQAFIGTASGITILPLPTGWTSSEGYAINNSGQIAGSVYAVSATQAFIGTASGITVIPLPTGWTYAYGQSINDSGRITGTVAVQVTDGVANGASDQAFIGTASGSTVIPLPAGFTLAYGRSINDSGQVAGTASNYASNISYAFIGTTSGSTLIPLPPGATSVDSTISVSLNNAGYVVGGSSGGGMNSGGWIWDATDGTQLLDNLVPPGWDITTPYNITNSGLILAEGTYEGGALQDMVLSPNVSATPEPGTLFLACAGALLFFTLRTRAVTIRAL